MRLPEYDRLDAVALAALVARREVTAAELLEAALERADARDPGLDAIVARYDDEARARAAGPLPAGPLSGVPFLLKDHLAAWKGHPLTSSSRLLEGFVPPFEAEVVRRIEAAGLVDLRPDQHARARHPRHDRARAPRARRGTRGTGRAPPAAPRAAPRPRSRRASSRPRTGATAAARSGSPPPPAACSG